MARILTKIQSAVYRATAVVNARYRDDVLDLQAMSLTYSTLLSLVPFLAVMFSMLKAFEVQNVLEPFLMQMLQPLGREASQVANRIIHFVDNISVGILGAAGVAMLFYTVVTLVAKVEDALNQIWRLPRSRTWPQRVTAYLSVVLVGPVMVFTALTLTASAQSYWLVERLFEIGFFSYMFTLATSVMPFVLLCATFTFLYKLMPYTNVRFSSALVGGATAGILWQLVGMGFAAFVANSAQLRRRLFEFCYHDRLSHLALCRMVDFFGRGRGHLLSPIPFRFRARSAPARERASIRGMVGPYGPCRDYAAPFFRQKSLAIH